MELLCFGGPLNEQVVNIPDRAWVWQAPVWREISYAKAEPIDWMEPAFDVVTYQRKRFGMGRRPDTTILYDPGVWWSEAQCLIAEGYPIHRIEDAINVLILLAGKALTVKPHTRQEQERRRERDMDRAAAQAWHDLMDQVAAGTLTLEQAQARAQIWRR